MSPFIPAAPTRRVAIATDARRGEVYLEVFDRHTLQSVCEPCCLAISDACVLLGREPVIIVGSGGELLTEALCQNGGDATAILPNLVPDALDMLFAAGELPIATPVKPLYLRPPDAKPPQPTSVLGAGA